MLDQAEGREAALQTTSTDDGSSGRSGDPALEPGVPGDSETMPPWRQLSHELRTPLHAILGNVELLLDGSAGPLSAQARDCLGDVQGAGQELLRQVALVQLLVQATASREAGTETVVDVVATLRTAFGKRGMAGEVEITPDDAALMLRGDPYWLETMAATLAGLFGPSACGGAGVSIAIGPAPAVASAGDLALRLAAPDAEPVAASPVRATLVEAIVRLHGGRVDATDQPGLILSWPVARVVEARADSPGAAGFASSHAR